MPSVQLSQTAIHTVSIISPSVESIETISLTESSAFVTPSETPAALQIFLSDEAENNLIELFSNNGNCKLPCLIGITPGVSSYDIVMKILYPFSGSSIINDSNRTEININPIIHQYNLLIDIGISIMMNNGIVSWIDIGVDTYNPNFSSPINKYPIFHIAQYNSEFNTYMLSNVLYSYGRPGIVYLEALGDTYSNPYYKIMNLLLVYPDLGIFIIYTTDISESGSIIKGCFDGAHFEMRLFTSINVKNLQDSLDADSKKHHGGYQSIDKTTTYSIDQFYKTFSSGKSNCLTTPSYYWPTDEPTN